MPKRSTTPPSDQINAITTALLRLRRWFFIPAAIFSWAVVFVDLILIWLEMAAWPPGFGEGLIVGVASTWMFIFGIPWICRILRNDS
ncbi:MAG: hypothetical protein ACI9MU_004138 [Alphaproteobacteria bacterium]|jgi:hypothetical protein